MTLKRGVSPIIRSTGSETPLPWNLFLQGSRRDGGGVTRQKHLDRNRVHNRRIVDTIQNERGTAPMTWQPASESKMFCGGSLR